MRILSLGSGSTGNTYHVDDGKTQLLIECGLPIKQIRKGLGYGLSYVTACLLSHSHKDHSKAAEDVATAGVCLYASEETLAAIEAQSGNLSPAYRFRVVPGYCYQIGTWTVQPFDVKHDVPGSLGFVCDSGSERLVYITDTPYCRYRFERITHLMIEANYDPQLLRENTRAGTLARPVKNRVLESHQSIDTVLKFLEAHDLAPLQEIWLLHLSHVSGDAETFKTRVMQATGKLVRIAGE